MYLKGKFNVKIVNCQFGGKKSSKIDAQEAKMFNVLILCMDPTIPTMHLSSHETLQTSPSICKDFNYVKYQMSSP